MWKSRKSKLENFFFFLVPCVRFRTYNPYGKWKMPDFRGAGGGYKEEENERDTGTALLIFVLFVGVAFSLMEHGGKSGNGERWAG